jgi:nucleoside-diphosphate-sugar epimerase
LGKALIRALVARGDEVRALARSERAASTIRKLGAEPVLGSLDDETSMRVGLDGADVAFHAAASVSNKPDRAAMFEDNVQGTKRFLTAARDSRVRRVVHVSTEAVLLGGGPIQNATEERPLPERSIGLYAETKKLAEQKAREFADSGLGVVIVRPRFIWGPDDTTLLPEMVAAVKSGDFRWIDGGRYPTSTCHVRNVVEGMLLAAERGRPGEAYFLTDGEPIELRRFVSALLTSRGVAPPTGEAPRWLLRLAAPVLTDVARLFGKTSPLTPETLLLFGEEVTVDDTKARRELGYQGRVSIEQGLKELGVSP